MQLESEESSEEASDGELLDAFSRGDAQAFAALVGRHQDVLRKHARSILGQGGPHEDAVQEVFLKLIRNTPALPASARCDAKTERAHLRSWLHTVTRNVCMDLIRNESRRKQREERTATSDIDNQSASEIEASDTRQAVERGLERLPRDQREVLVLRLLGGRSYGEIAVITGRKVGTVGWLVSEGLKALSDQLAPMLGLAPQAAPRTAAAVHVRYAQGETS